MDLFNIFTVPTNALQWIAIFTFIIAGILFIRRNDIKSLREANIDLRASLKDKQDQITDLQTQIDKLKVLVDKFEALLREKDKRINALENISVIQALSPEQVAYMSDMKGFTREVHEYMINSSKALTEINSRSFSKSLK